MKITIDDARAECRRYLDYLAREEKKSEALLRLASDRRAGRCDDREKDCRLRDIMGSSPTVYDGGNLADAVRIMLKATEPPISASKK